MAVIGGIGFIAARHADAGRRRTVLHASTVLVSAAIVAAVKNTPTH
jgi:hypothetical protein